MHVCKVPLLVMKAKPSHFLSAVLLKEHVDRASEPKSLLSFFQLQYPRVTRVTSGVLKPRTGFHNSRSQRKAGLSLISMESASDCEASTGMVRVSWLPFSSAGRPAQGLRSNNKHVSPSQVTKIMWLED